MAERKLPGRLCFAEHLPMGHPNTEIMLRAEGGTSSPPVYVIYLDGKEADRLSLHTPREAYDRCDELAGCKLADLRGPDLEASMGR